MQRAKLLIRGEENSSHCLSTKESAYSFPSQFKSQFFPPKPEVLPRGQLLFEEKISPFSQTQTAVLLQHKTHHNDASLFSLSRSRSGLRAGNPIGVPWGPIDIPSAQIRCSGSIDTPSHLHCSPKTSSPSRNKTEQESV